MKTSTEITRDLAALGYKYWDKCSILHQGMTHVFRGPNCRHRVFIDLWEDNEGGEDFWHMSMRICFKDQRQLVLMEVSVLIEEDMGRIKEYEQRLLSAAAAFEKPL